MNVGPKLSKVFVIPVLKNIFLIFAGLFVAATPYLPEVYAAYPILRSIVFFVGPLIAMIAVVNMIFATLKTVAQIGATRAKDVQS